MRLIDADELLNKVQIMLMDIGCWNEERVEQIIKKMPSAEPEIKPIEYRDCANAMLKMWMDNVVTDREYNRIMGKLNAHWRMENG